MHELGNDLAAPEKVAEQPSLPGGCPEQLSQQPPPFAPGEVASLSSAGGAAVGQSQGAEQAPSTPPPAAVQHEYLHGGPASLAPGEMASLSSAGGAAVGQGQGAEQAPSTPPLAAVQHEYLHGGLGSPALGEMASLSSAGGAAVEQGAGQAPSTPPLAAVQCDSLHGGQASHEQASAPFAVEAPVGVPAPGTPGLGVKRPKVYSTPADDLAAMMPPGAKILFNHNDHRFSSTWVGPVPQNLPPELGGKHFSRSFGPNKSWKDALSEVHYRLWDKWSYCSKLLPLPAGTQRQEPGVVPTCVVNAMEHHISKLPPRKDYTKR